MLEQQKSLETSATHLHRGSRKRRHSSAGASFMERLKRGVFIFFFKSGISSAILTSLIFRALEIKFHHIIILFLN